MEDNYIDTEKACSESKRRFRRLMRKIMAILAAIFLALLLLLAERYNWFGPLPTPLRSIVRYVRYNLPYIKTGLLVLLFALSWIAFNMGINRYEKRRCKEIERNVTESVPISLEEFLNDWSSVPANYRSGSFLKRPQFGYKYVFLSGVYVIAELDNAKFVSHFFRAYRLFIIAVWERRCLVSAIRNSVSKCCEKDINIYPLGHCETSVYELFEDMVKSKNAIISNKLLEKIENILYVQ